VSLSEVVRERYLNKSVGITYGVTESNVPSQTGGTVTEVGDGYITLSIGERSRLINLAWVVQIWEVARQ